MKNVVLGIIGCLIVLYTAMLGLSVYNMTVRENQMEKSLSLALSGAMNRYYEPNMYIVDKKPVSSYDVEKAVIEDINESLTLHMSTRIQRIFFSRCANHLYRLPLS